MNDRTLFTSPLGEKSAYTEYYDPNLLFPIPRQAKRDEINLASPLPFSGADIWTAYELSWLNDIGKPLVAIGEFTIPCGSKYIVESKSLKLYLNSFNQQPFADTAAVQQIIANDLGKATDSNIAVRLINVHDLKTLPMTRWEGSCLDDLDIAIDCYQPNPDLLATENEAVEETVFSHLLKSNCLVTSQPDWGSVLIRYAGNKINHKSLLKYIISFRQHNEFHEQCVERIFNDILQHCQPDKLTVYARYTRRGGLDINPFRSNFEETPKNLRLLRQ